MAKSKSINILIVEDDVFLSDLYKTKFNLEGFKVSTAFDGEKGIEMVGKVKPDIVLLDLILPKKSGFEVLEAVRTNEVTSDLPVILLTNLSQKEDVKKGLKLGANDYLIKAHFMPSEVVDKIRELVGK